MVDQGRSAGGEKKNKPTAHAHLLGFVGGNEREHVVYEYVVYGTLDVYGIDFSSSSSDLKSTCIVSRWERISTPL
jgi:hypothetical protein